VALRTCLQVPQVPQMNYRYRLAKQRYIEIDNRKRLELEKSLTSALKGEMMFTVKIHSNETYHLYEGTQSVPFREVLRLDNPITKFPLQKKYGKVWENVGEIRLRDLLLMTPDINPLFHSLQRSRANYRWSDFLDARKKKYDL